MEIGSFGGTVDIGEDFIGTLNCTSFSGTVDIGRRLGGIIPGPYGNLNFASGGKGEVVIGDNANGNIHATTTLDATITIGGNLGGTVSAGGDLASTIQVDGSITSTGVIEAGDDWSSGSLTVGSHMSGTIDVTGDIESDIALGGNLTGDIIAGGLLSSDIVIDGNVDSGGNITIGGALTSTGRILLEADCDGDITIGEQTDSSSQIVIRGAFDDNASITINDSRGAFNAGGSIYMGPVLYPYPPPSATFDGSIMIKSPTAGFVGGDLTGTIEVLGCHDPADALDICICCVMCTENSVTLTQTDCDPQVRPPGRSRTAPHSLPWPPRRAAATFAQPLPRGGPLHLDRTRRGLSTLLVERA